MNGNRKLFWKEVSYGRIKDGNVRLALEEVELRRI